MLDRQAGSLGQQPALLDGGQARAILAVVGEMALQCRRLRCRHGRQHGKGGSIDAAGHSVRQACWKLENASSIGRERPTVTYSIGL